MYPKTAYLARLKDEKRDLITASELAGQIAVNPRTVWAMVRRGDLPAPMRIGDRCSRWSVRELQEWIDRGCPKQEAAQQ